MSAAVDGGGAVRFAKNPVVQFLAAGLLVLVVVVIGTVQLSSRAADEEALNDAQATTELLARSVAQPAIPRGLAAGNSGAVDRFDRTVLRRLLVGEVRRSNIWNAQGGIVYSDETRLIGDRFPLGPEELDVLRNGGTDAEISDLSEPENRFEPAGQSLVEVYTRVRSPEGEPLLFEAYYSATDIARRREQVYDSFQPIALGGLLVLVAVTTPLLWALTRRLDRTGRDRARLLERAADASESERRRIARDLHDGVVQDLAGTAFALSATARDAGTDTDTARRRGVRRRTGLAGRGPAGLAGRAGGRPQRPSALRRQPRHGAGAAGRRPAHPRRHRRRCRVRPAQAGVRARPAQPTGPDRRGRRHARRPLRARRRHHRPPGGSMNEAPIRVVLVDDHAVVRSGLAQLLGGADDIEVVGQAGDGAEALAVVRETQPDVVVMDLQMPGIDGVETTRRLVSLDLGCEVLVLTSYSDNARIVAALDAGAVGYLLKDADPEEVIGGVRAVSRGESPLNPRVARQLLTTRAEAPASVELTPREAEVLGLVRQGLANKQIARRLGISERTVKAHLTNVFQRIGVADRTQAALWAERNL